MLRIAAVFVLGVAVFALAACGDGNKPPLTPDSEHSTELPDGGAAPATPDAPPPAK